MKSDEKAMFLLLFAFVLIITGGFAFGAWIDTNSENVEKEKFRICIEAGKTYDEGTCK